MEAWKLSHQSFFPAKNHQSVKHSIETFTKEVLLKSLGGIEKICANKVINLYVENLLGEILIQLNSTKLDDHHAKKHTYIDYDSNSTMKLPRKVYEHRQLQTKIIHKSLTYKET